jgi:hypothetical protein
MKKPAFVWLLVIGLLVLSASPGYAWHSWHGGRGGVFIGVGPGYWWGPPYPYWYPPPYYVYPPPVVVEEPPVYVQPPAPPPASSAPPADWYYCSSAKGYYPNVQTCPEAWVKVPARPQ